MRIELSSGSVVEALVTVAVAVLLTFAGFRMLIDVVGNPVAVGANASTQHPA